MSDRAYNRRNPVTAQERVVGADGFGYLVTARATIDEGECLWVDVEVFGVTCVNESGAPMYGELMGAGPSLDPFHESVEPDLSGFVKWDGCTQLYFAGDGGREGPGMHIDDAEGLELWFAAIRKARQMAGMLLTGWDRR